MLSPQPAYPTPNRCHLCGATNYRNVLARDSQGAMRPTAQIICSGCNRQYANVQAWRSPEAPTDLIHQPPPPG